MHKTLIVYVHGSLDNTNGIHFDAPEDKSIILFNTVGNNVTLPIEKIEELKKIYHENSSLYENNDKNIKLLSSKGKKWINNIELCGITSEGIKQYVLLQPYYNHKDNVDKVKIPNLLLNFDNKSGAQLIYADGSHEDITDIPKTINLKDLIDKYKDVNSFLIISCLANHIKLNNFDLNLLSRIVKPSNKICTRSIKRKHDEAIKEWDDEDDSNSKGGRIKNKKTRKKNNKKTRKKNNKKINRKKNKKTKKNN
jgi:hypothetical protein